jgi:hypothetical protein
MKPKWDEHQRPSKARDKSSSRNAADSAILRFDFAN